MASDIDHTGDLICLSELSWDELDGERETLVEAARGRRLFFVDDAERRTGAEVCALLDRLMDEEHITFCTVRFQPSSASSKQAASARI